MQVYNDINGRRLSILILSVNVPFPPDDGGKICVFGFIDYLRRCHDFTLFIPSFSVTNSLLINKLKIEWPDVRIEYIEFFSREEIIGPPQRKKTLSLRILNRVIRKLQSYAEKISVRTINEVAKEIENKPDENELFFNRYFNSPTNPYPAIYIQKLKEVLSLSKYDIIQVELSRNLNLVNVLPKESALVFEQIESRFSVIKDYSLTKSIDPFLSEYLSSYSETIEDAFMSRFDAIFALNDADKAHLTKKFPSLSVYKSPFGVLDKDIQEADFYYKPPTYLIFSGHEAHFPNYDALLWYLEEIHCIVTASNAIKLVVTGRWSESTKNFLTNKYNNLAFSGFVQDYLSILKNTIMIVPVRIGGGGIRTKILYAMGNYVPVVSTSIGALGINVKDQENIIIADTAIQYAEAIENLLSDEILFKKLCLNAYDLISNNYSQTYTSKLRRKFYEEISSRNKYKLLL